MLDRLKATFSRPPAAPIEKAQERLQLFVQQFTQWKDAAWPRITFKRLVDEGYAKHAIVFACVQRWATTIPGARLRVYRVDTDEVDPTHDVNRILKRPNPVMTQRQFMRYFVTYGTIGGIVAAWKERDRAGRVLHLWPLHRGQIAPVPNPDGWLLGWKFDPGDGRVPVFIPPEDIIYWQWAIDPTSPLDGLSPLTAAAKAIDTGAEAIRYVYALLKNDAVTRTAIVVKNVLPPNIKERMLTQYAEQYGDDNRGRPAVIEGQEATIQRIGANLQELAADALHDVPDSWICTAFDIPSVLVGSTGGLRRAIQGAPKEMQEFWIENSVLPRWGEIEDAFNIHLLDQEYGDDRVELRFDMSTVRALADDLVALRTSIADLWQKGIMLLDEARAALGLPQIAGGNVRLQSAGMQEVDPDVVAPKAEPIEVGKVNAILAGLTAAGKGEISPEALRGLMVYLVGTSELAADKVVIIPEEEPEPEPAQLPPPAAGPNTNGKVVAGDNPPEPDDTPMDEGGEVEGEPMPPGQKAIDESGKFIPADPSLAPPGDPRPTEDELDAAAASFQAWIKKNAPEFAGLFED